MVSPLQCLPFILYLTVYFQEVWSNLDVFMSSLSLSRLVELYQLIQKWKGREG